MSRCSRLTGFVHRCVTNLVPSVASLMSITPGGNLRCKCKPKLQRDNTKTVKHVNLLLLSPGLKHPNKTDVEVTIFVCDTFYNVLLTNCSIIT